MPVDVPCCCLDPPGGTVYSIHVRGDVGVRNPRRNQLSLNVATHQETFPGTQEGRHHDWVPVED